VFNGIISKNKAFRLRILSMDQIEDVVKE